MDQPGMVTCSWSRSRLRIWSRETSLAVLSRVSLLISILRLNLVLTYLRDSSQVPRRRPFIFLNRHTPSGQSRNCVPMAFTAECPPVPGQ